MSAYGKPLWPRVACMAPPRCRIVHPEGMCAALSGVWMPSRLSCGDGKHFDAGTALCAINADMRVARWRCTPAMP